jgi:hypothetical protein
MNTHDPIDVAVVSLTQAGENKISIVSKGTLDIGGWSNIDCYNVTDGRRMLRLVKCESFFTLIGFDSKLINKIPAAIRIIDHNPQPRKISELIDQLKAPLEIVVEGITIPCFEHTVITKYCKAVGEARRAHKISGASFLEYAESCERFLAAAADLGLVALIDEATGYIQEKQKHEYRDLFRDFIRKEMREWEKEFPDQFFDGIYKIYKIPRQVDKNHPQFFAKFIRKYVYHPLADSHGIILSMLDEKNPVVGKGRKHKLHQFLDDQVGLTKLRAHVWQIVGILGSVNSKSSFQKGFRNAFPRAFDQMELELDDI